MLCGLSVPVNPQFTKFLTQLTRSHHLHDPRQYFIVYAKHYCCHWYQFDILLQKRSALVDKTLRASMHRYLFDIDNFCNVVRAVIDALSKKYSITFYSGHPPHLNSPLDCLIPAWIHHDMWKYSQLEMIIGDQCTQISFIVAYLINSEDGRRGFTCCLVFNKKYLYSMPPSSEYWNQVVCCLILIFLSKQRSIVQNIFWYIHLRVFHVVQCSSGYESEKVKLELHISYI